MAPFQTDVTSALVFFLLSVIVISYFFYFFGVRLSSFPTEHLFLDFYVLINCTYCSTFVSLFSLYSINQSIKFISFIALFPLKHFQFALVCVRSNGQFA